MNPTNTVFEERVAARQGDGALAVASGMAAIIYVIQTVAEAGAALSPSNAFLILQGLETLALRVERHCENALKVTHYLHDHPQVAWFKYAGLTDHALAQQYCAGKPASILSFGIVDGQEAGARFIDALKRVVTW